MDVKQKWASTPAPVRGGIVKQIGVALQDKKAALASLLCMEMGKIMSEALGEIQEFIDICDYAVGMSRMLPGAVFPSERASHALMEMWNPLGIVGIITAFNFPVAVYGWNVALSLICGNCNIWKGSNTASLITVATFRIVADILASNGFAGVVTLITGEGSRIAEKICADPRVALVSFTGSTRVGRLVSEAVHGRFGKVILELGGNNASVVLPDADVDLVIPACVFAAVGTCGQRCTSLRRLIIHQKVYDSVVEKLLVAYKSLVPSRVGLPWLDTTIVGPLHSEESYENCYVRGIQTAIAQGGRIIFGGQRISGCGIFVEPTIIEIDSSAAILQEELFCPILFVMKCDSLEAAIRINNNVEQGLSSSIFTTDLKSVFKWMGPTGSDCGLVNVNCSTSGAEIGGAFGGEKATGGGRESGSESWKQYMRRSTCTVNFSDEVPLAQGVSFEV
jgi:aldehyde dehydrogenase family 7 member A1